MTLSLTTIWIAAVLSIALVGGLALRMIFAPENAQDRKRSARLKALGPVGQKTQAEALVRDQGKDQIGRDWPLVGNLTLILQRAGMQGRGLIVLMMTVAAGFLLGALMSLMLGGYIAFPLAFVVAGMMAVNILKARHNKRTNALVQQMPDALDLMMRGLRVGHPVNATIANVARTMPDPIGAEFRIVNEQIAHGDYLTDAFQDFAERIGQEDAEYLSVAINIQHGTGGNLAEMLGTLSGVIRDRIVMRRRIVAISSEGRLSAWLLSSLPLIIYIATSITSPGYYSGVSEDPMFKPMMGAIVVLVLANFFALRKLVSIKV